jgi:ElaB/YqjD/DUF883 family membrane-anchored ribosome-binding protein
MKNREENRKAGVVAAEIEDIRHGIDSLKDNVVDLARNLKEVSLETAQNAASYARERAVDLKETGGEALHRVEKRIQAKPTQSVAVAFFAGVLASILMRNKA